MMKDCVKRPAEGNYTKDGSKRMDARGVLMEEERRIKNALLENAPTRSKL
jgi:hypothetical protein